MGVGLYCVSATCTSMSGGSVSDCALSLGALLLLESASCGEAQHQGALAAPWACVAFRCVTHIMGDLGIVAVRALA